MLLRNLDSLLVAGGATVAELAEMAPLVYSSVSFLWNDGERCAFRVSCLL